MGYLYGSESNFEAKNKFFTPENNSETWVLNPEKNRSHSVEFLLQPEKKQRKKFVFTERM